MSIVFTFVISDVLVLPACCLFLLQCDFKSLGRHSWCCKEWLCNSFNDRSDDTKLADTNNQNSDQSNTVRNDAVLRNQGRISNVDYVKCCCGKKCKGIRGLKAHQRSHRFIKGMCSELLLPLEEETINDCDQINDVDEHIGINTPNLKPGVELPKTELEWKEADLYFRAELPISEISECSVNDCVSKMTNLTYDYFAENFGTVNKSSASDSEYLTKYADYSKQDLKRELKTLKRRSPVDVENIKYMSRLLRKLAQKECGKNVRSINHDEEIRRNFWAYAKSHLDSTNYQIPTLT